MKENRCAAIFSRTNTRQQCGRFVLDWGEKVPHFARLRYIKSPGVVTFNSFRDNRTLHKKPQADARGFLLGKVKEVDLFFFF